MNDIKDHFNRILYPQSFATELEDIDNNDIIHWPSPPHVLWSKSIARRTIWGTSFQKFDVRYIALYHLRVYLTSTGYQKIVSTPGKSPSAGAKSKDYAEGQALEAQAIHDG